MAKVTATNNLGTSQSAMSKAIVLPRSEDIAPEITFEDVTGDSMSLNFKGNEGIDTYTINVYKRDPNTGEFVLDQVVTKTVGEDERRRLMGRQLAMPYTCPTTGAVTQEITALEPNTEY